MIVSASFRTDIPAYYGEWFMNRLRAGFCRVANPYGGGDYRVSLAREDVDGFVFWTKNAGPFLPHLEEVHARGFPFVVQLSILGLPKALEPSVPDAERAIAHAREIAERFGPRALVWRYDPIVVTSATRLDWHRRRFAELARALAGTTDEVVISYVHPYRKTLRNLTAAGQRAGFVWRDPGDEEKRDLVIELADVARSLGMDLTVCTQPQWVTGRARPARCVDGGRLSDVAGRPLRARVKGNRPGCECHESRDIGAYDTCPAGCVYCYAVERRRTAQDRARGHDPRAERISSRSGARASSAASPESGDRSRPGPAAPAGRRRP